MSRFLAALLILAAGTLSATASARPALRVAYAGSMGTVMDKALGPAFAKAHHIRYQGIGQGAYGLARLLASRHLTADVFISVTPGPARLLLRKGLLKSAVPVASTQMVIAYSPKSRYAAQFKAAGEGTPWYKVLEQPGVRFGRTDPATDPQGRNIIFTFQLAQRYYHQPGLAGKVLGPKQNPRQIFSESSLLTRLESGQIDASSGYLSAVKSRHLPYIKLPPQINLSNPAYMKSWYSRAKVSLNGKTMKPQPLVFYAGVLGNARHPGLAKRFIEYLKSRKGQKLLHRYGYGKPHGGPLRAGSQ